MIRDIEQDTEKPQTNIVLMAIGTGINFNVFMYYLLQMVPSYCLILSLLSLHITPRELMEEAIIAQK